MPPKTTRRNTNKRKALAESAKTAPDAKVAKAQKSAKADKSANAEKSKKAEKSAKTKNFGTAASAMNPFADLPGTLTDPGWRRLLQPLFQTDSWRALIDKLAARQAGGEVIYPPVSCVLRAFNLTPLDSVRVVILGQDPYHGPGQADGLAFSFSGNEALPPTLKNLFKELAADIPGFVAPKSGCLEKWARQGVLLLNTALTVGAGKPGSHAKLGWAAFTDEVLRLLCANARQPLVFLLWGKPAQAKAPLLSCGPSHVILTAAHPSPAACGAFNGCRHFSKANAALTAGPAVDWRLD
ncbi:hypothetical protein BOX15_Mlig012152g4 [Macrostomum lignano]|uniref:Uracil-DNA glycosylase n=2 Tax=Macrostomum lignano TaxID=282301 RepID=A0A1I8IJS7_9PLAT|nr:hypothetical protein BOX15_Mlig012152g4 [Macrostomum lignano]